MQNAKCYMQIAICNLLNASYFKLRAEY